MRPTWRRLIDSQSGITSIKDRGPQFAALPSQVAGVVPQGNRDDGGWNAAEWLRPGVGSLISATAISTSSMQLLHISRTSGRWHSSPNMQWLVQMKL